MKALIQTALIHAFACCCYAAETSASQPQSGAITIKTLQSGSKLYPQQVASVTLLGLPAKLNWTRNDEGLTVELPEQRPSDFAYVLKIERK